MAAASAAMHACRRMVTAAVLGALQESGSGSSESRDVSAAAPALAMSINATQLQRYCKHALCTVSSPKSTGRETRPALQQRKTAGLCVRPTSGIPLGAESACFGHVEVAAKREQLCCQTLITTSARSLSTLRRHQRACHNTAAPASTPLCIETGQARGIITPKTTA